MLTVNFEIFSISFRNSFFVSGSILSVSILDVSVFITVGRLVIMEGTVSINIMSRIVVVPKRKFANFAFWFIRVREETK